MVEKFQMFAPGQDYTEEYLQKLWENDLVIYNPRWCFGIRIIPRKGSTLLFEILGEDDGQLFSYKEPFTFDSCWADGIIECLEEAKIRSKRFTDSHCDEGAQQASIETDCNHCKNVSICKYTKQFRNSKSNLELSILPPIMQLSINCSSFVPKDNEEIQHESLDRS